MCQKPAGWGTDHVGQGRCRLHGGLTPVRHGRYSMIQRDSLRELAEQMATDPDPLNLVDDLIQARALYVDFINRYDTYAAALLAWHESYQASERPIGEDRIMALETVVDELEALLGPADLDEYDEDDPGGPQRKAIMEARKLIAYLRAPNGDGKPRQIMDVADAWRILSEATKIGERIERIRAANAISRPDLMRLMAEMGRVVVHHASDEVARKIKDDWLRIKVA